MKKADIMKMSDDQLRTLAVDQQRKIDRLYKSQLKLKRTVEAKQAVIMHLQNNNMRCIVDAVQRMIPLKQCRK
ncbi:hypothetical protein [Prosthecochloris sp.]|uniref:hypothetical protein n=1 Tax=Prosthecochloris sp. TaxID=290513 RepID=UPI0025DD3F15|nr:hypothetical protein [Prosthecochloris sp.]